MRKQKIFKYKKCECCNRLVIIPPHVGIYPVLCSGCSLYHKKLKEKIYALRKRNLKLEKKFYGISYGGACVTNKKMKKLLK